MSFLVTVLCLACGETGGPDPKTENAASPGSPGPGQVRAGLDAATRRMVARLDSVAEAADLGLTLYHSDHRLEALRARPPGPDLRSRLTYGLALSDELLHEGRFSEAVATYDSVRSLVDMNRDTVPDDFAGEVLERLAAAHLHRSFQRRCVDAHTVAPCLLAPEPVAPDRTDG
ncbi:MAG TPA: hypothetical protein VE173_12295, partial [Longimicrobiales bacterium]|nr:hypothetical protein [Longimicrobiales bacterium]